MTAEGVLSVLSGGPCRFFFSRDRQSGRLGLRRRDGAAVPPGDFYGREEFDSTDFADRRRTVRPEDVGAYPTSTTTRERFWSRREGRKP